MECLKAKCCRKCLDAAWSSSHECSPVCAKCDKTEHIQACHKHHETDNDLYERICKESRKRRGSSASGPSSAKKSKPAPKEGPKDLKNQLEKARLEGVREGLEKREASLSSSQGSSKRGGGRGRGRGKGQGGKQQGQGKAATDSTPKKEKD